MIFVRLLLKENTFLAVLDAVSCSRIKNIMRNMFFEDKSDLAKEAYLCLKKSKANSCLFKNRETEVVVLTNNYKPSNYIKIDVPKSDNVRKRRVIIPKPIDWSVYNSLLGKIRVPFTRPYLAEFWDSLEEHLKDIEDCKRNLLKYCQERNINKVLYIDIKEAFNTVDQKILLNILRSKGIDSRDISLLKDFFVFWQYSNGIPSIWLQKYSSLFGIYLSDLKENLSKNYNFFSSSDCFYFPVANDDCERSFLVDLEVRLKELNLEIGTKKYIEFSSGNSLTTDYKSRRLLNKLNNEIEVKNYRDPDLAFELLERNLAFTPESFNYLKNCLEENIELFESFEEKHEKVYLNSNFKDYLAIWIDWLFDNFKLYKLNGIRQKEIILKLRQL